LCKIYIETVVVKHSLLLLLGHGCLLLSCHGLLELGGLVLHHLLELRVFLELECFTSQAELSLFDAILIEELVKCFGLLHLHH